MPLGIRDLAVGASATYFERAACTARRSQHNWLKKRGLKDGLNGDALVNSNASMARSRRFRFRLRTLFLLMVVPVGVIQLFLWRNEVIRARKMEELNGMGSGAAFLVEDGDLVLFRKRGTFGALVVTAQGMKPEKMDFEWYYREDGDGNLAIPNPGVFHGQGTAEMPTSAANIRFGPFELQWSGGDDGFGWVYFPRSESADSATEVCHVGRKRLDRIDAADPRWVFQTHNDQISTRR